MLSKLNYCILFCSSVAIRYYIFLSSDIFNHWYLSLKCIPISGIQIFHLRANPGSWSDFSWFWKWYGPNYYSCCLEWLPPGWATWVKHLRMAGPHGPGLRQWWNWQVYFLNFKTVSVMQWTADSMTVFGGSYGYNYWYTTSGVHIYLLAN